MPRVAIILGIFLATALAWGDSFAQVPKEPRTIKLDEFGKVGHCDVTARLDNLAIEVAKNPGSLAYVLTYAPDGDGPGTGKQLLELVKDYLVNSRGLDPRHVKTVYGGRNSSPYQPKIELWIVPKGGQPPEPTILETDVDTFKGLFSARDDDEDFGVYIEPEMGPGIGETTDAAFADMLHQQKNAIGYVVTYNGEHASPGAWRKVADSKIEYLKQFNVDASRLKVIFAGHQKTTHLQLWLLPSDAPPPLAAAKELPPAKAFKTFEVYSANLADNKNQLRLFNRITEILRDNSSICVLFVVRLDPPAPPAAEEEEPSTEPVFNIPPIQLPINDDLPVERLEEYEPLDLTRLVESWRLELTGTHKIAEDRIVVVFATADEYQPETLELWLIPKDQPLPEIRQPLPPEELKEEPAKPAGDVPSGVAPVHTKRP